MKKMLILLIILFIPNICFSNFFHDIAKKNFFDDIAKKTCCFGSCHQINPIKIKKKTIQKTKNSTDNNHSNTSKLKVK